MAHGLSGKEGRFVTNQRARQRNDDVLRPIAKVQALPVAIESNVQLDAMGSPRGWKLAPARRFKLPKIAVEDQVEVGFVELSNHGGLRTARQFLSAISKTNRRLCTTVCAKSGDHTLPQTLRFAGPIPQSSSSLDRMRKFNCPQAFY